MTINNKNNPELFDELKEVCSFSVNHIPKHNSGYVKPEATSSTGRKFICATEWDYTWGIDWEYVEWEEVDEFVKTCPCCGQIIDND